MFYGGRRDAGFLGTTKRRRRGRRRDDDGDGSVERRGMVEEAGAGPS